MNRVKSILFKVMLAALPLTGAFVAAEGVASAQYDYPPPEAVATITPVYYQGRPHYYYNNHWYYRNGATWGHYQAEPGYFRDYRAHYAGGYHSYNYHYHR